MKTRPAILSLAFVASFVCPNVQAEDKHLGGVSEIRLMVSTYTEREQGVSSNTADFSFPAFSSNWNGVFTEGDRTTVRNDALQSCIDSALNVSVGSCTEGCYYWSYQEVFVGYDNGFPQFDFRSIRLLDTDCYIACHNVTQQQYDAAYQSCAADPANQMQVDYGSVQKLFSVKPGKIYEINVTNAADVFGVVSLVAPSGYRVSVENEDGLFVPRKMVRFGTSEASKTVRFQIQDLKPLSPGEGLGRASELMVGDIKWGIDLGSLKNGSSAGSLMFHENDLVQGLYDRGVLELYYPDASSDGEVEIIRDGGGKLRQVRTPQCFVDIVDTVTSGSQVIQYEIRVYAPLPYSGSGNVYSVPGGQTLLSKYAIGRGASDSSNDFFVKTYDGGTLIITETLVRNPQGASTSEGIALNNWTLTRSGHGSNAVSKTVTVTNTAAGALRQEVSSISHSASDYTEQTKTYSTLRQYAKYAQIPEYLRIEQRDSGAGNRLYQYIPYVSNPVDPVTHGRTAFTIDPFSGWTFLNYRAKIADGGNLITPTNLGEEGLIIESGDTGYDISSKWNTTFFTDVVAANSWSVWRIPATQNDYDGVSSRSAGEQIQRFPNGQGDLTTVRESVNQASFFALGGEQIEVVCQYMPYDFPKATNRYRANYMARYTPLSGNPLLYGKPYFEFNSDGSKVSYGYKEVNYRGITNAFVELRITGYHTGNLAYNDTGDVSLSTMTHGQTTYEHSGIDFDMDAILTLDFKSSKEVLVFDEQGNLRFKELWLNSGGDNWTKYEDIVNTYDTYGRMLTSSRNGRTISETSWSGLYKAWEDNEQDVRTVFIRDGLGRVIQEDIQGASGVAGIPTTRTTHKYYDAKDRQVVTKTPSGGGGDLITRRTLDAEGRVLSKTDANGLTTGYTYTGLVSGQRVDVANPNGTTEIRLKKPNGEPLQNIVFASDGTTVLSNEVKIYNDNATVTGGNGITATNRLVRTDYFEQASSSNPHPYTVQVLNAAGRVIYDEKGSPVTNAFERFYQYDPSTGQVDEINETEVPETTALTGTATKTYLLEYDDMGNRVRVGIDVNGGGLAIGGSDRITDQEKVYEEDNGWWLTEKTTLYPQNGQATAIVTYKRKQLTGLATSQIGITETKNAQGSVIKTITTVNRANKSVTSVIDYPDASTSQSVTINGLEQSMTSREGHLTTYEYDSAGRKVKENHPRGFATVLTYDPSKERLKSIAHGVSAGQPQGYVTTASFNAKGEIEWVENPEGRKTYFTFNGRGQVTHKWGAATRPVWNEYDSFGQLWKVHTYRAVEGETPDFGKATWPAGAGDGDVMTYLYNNTTGLVTSMTDAAGRQTLFAYDQLERLRTRTTPAANADADTTVTAAITTTYQYFSKTDELKKITYAGDGGVTPSLDFTYHRTGQIASVTEGGSHTRHYRFNFTSGNGDSMKLVQEDLPGYYTAVSSGVSGGGDHEIDAIARLYQDDDDDDRVKGRPEYLMLGMKSAAPGNLDTTHYESRYGYDQQARMDEVNIEGTQTLYGFLANSNHIQTRSRGSLVETRAYEPNRDLLTSIEMKYSATSKVKHSYTYDPMARRDTQVQQGSHFAPYGGALFTDYSYNPRSEVTDMDVFRSSSPTTSEALRVPGRGFAWDYDLAGNHRSVTHKSARAGQGSLPGNLTYTRTSNSLNQYSSLANPDYAEVSGVVDAAWKVSIGNDPSNITRARRAGDYFHNYALIRGGNNGVVHDSVTLYGVKNGAGAGGKDQLFTQPQDVTLRPKAEDLKYDSRGNLTLDGLWQYTWDAENRLVAMESTTSAILAGVAPQKLRFKYDYLGRRYAKENYTWNGTAFSATVTVTTLYYWDAWNLVYEAKYNHAGSTTFDEAKSYYWGLDWSGSLQGASGVGGLIGIRKHDGISWSDTYYPSYDGNGNLMGIYQSNGTPRAEYEYGAYGKLLRASGDLADLNPFRFATKYLDAETGLYQYQHRYYSPHMGRFLSQDPAGEGVNLYALVNNGPVNNFDVFGLYGYYPEMPSVPSLQDFMFLGPEAASALADRQWQAWERSVASTTSYYNDIARIYAIGSIRAMDAASEIRREFVTDWAIAEIKGQAAARDYLNSQRSYWNYGIGVGGKKSGPSTTSQWVHGTLEGLGMTPGFGIPFDIANGIVYAVEGDGFNAALSFGAAVPVLGYTANAARGARYADEFIGFAGHFGDDAFAGAARYGDNFLPSNSFNDIQHIRNANIGGGSIVGSRFENEIYEIATRGEIPLPVQERDFAIRHLMADITSVTGHEVALLRLKDGNRVLRLGSEGGVGFTDDIKRIIAHTHPSSVLEFSSSDVRFLKELQQRSSVLIDPVSTMGVRNSVK